MSNNKENSVSALLFDLFKTLVVSLVLYYIPNTIMRAAFEDSDDMALLGFVATVVMYAVYAVAFYIIRVRKSADTYSLYMDSEPYSLKKDIKDIFASDGKNLMIIYGVLALIFEVCQHLPAVIGIIPTVILLPLFPLCSMFYIPVLTSLVGWAMLVLISFGATAYGHFKIKRMREKGNL